MATTATNAPAALPLSVMSQQLVKKYTDTIFSSAMQDLNFRAKLLYQDQLYYRTLDTTQEQARAVAANRLGDTKKMQNVVVPVVGPQVDSAKAYFVEMFLSSYPIFPVVTSPELVDVGLQLETIMGQSAQEFQWGRQLALCFQDGLKHNLQALEVDWEVKAIRQVVSDASKSVSFGIPKTINFAGNSMKRIGLYNLIFDRRVPPSEVHTRGEYVGYSELITRIELKQLFLDLDSSLTMNATDAFNSGTAATTDVNASNSTFYIPPVNPEALNTSSFNAFSWVGWANQDTVQKIRYSSMYEKTVLYVRVIPKEFAIHSRGGKPPGDPQIYKLIIINQKVIIYAKRMTNAHEYLPIILGQMNEDGHGLQTKSYADNAGPYQFLASALYNSGLASQRRKVYDRLLYDPSRINKADIDKVDPVARIPVKTEGYGKPIHEAIHQLPYRDENVATILQMGREVIDMADVSTGQNRAQRGQFQKGNKTRHEFDSVMGNSDARPRTSAILLGISWFAPIKTILKTNILQYQPPVGMFNLDQKKMVEIDPTKLRTISWEFQLADGIMPSDKFLSFDLFGQVLQYAGINPAAAAEWDLTGMFAYQLKAQGARWVDTFRRTPQQQEQFLAQTAAAQQPQPQLPPPV